MDTVVTVTAKPNGDISVSPGKDSEALASWIASVLKNDVSASKALQRTPYGVTNVAVKGTASKAMELEFQAGKWDDILARNQNMDRELRRYYVEKAAECRAEAARLRGEAPAPSTAREPLSK